MPEEEFETMEFKEKLEEATERAVEAAQAWAWCREHQAQGTSAYLDDVPTVRLYTTAAGAAAKSQ